MGKLEKTFLILIFEGTRINLFKKLKLLTTHGRANTKEHKRPKEDYGLYFLFTLI